MGILGNESEKVLCIRRNHYRPAECFDIDRFGNRCRYCRACRNRSIRCAKGIRVRRLRASRCIGCGKPVKNGSQCRKCQLQGTANKTKRYRLRKQLAVNLFGGRCAECGFTHTNCAVFDFDHIDPASKSMPIARALFLSWEKALVELKKCRLLCVNCHRIRKSRHAGTSYAYVVYRTNRERAVQMLGGVCLQCGKAYPVPVFDFHHKDPMQKVEESSRLFSRRWELVEPELKERELLCGVCHRLTPHNVPELIKIPRAMRGSNRSN
jgi:hypothetical protein